MCVQLGDLSDIREQHDVCLLCFAKFIRATYEHDVGDAVASRLSTPESELYTSMHTGCRSLHAFLASYGLSGHQQDVQRHGKDQDAAC